MGAQEKNYKDILKQEGVKSTKNRHQIIKILENDNKPVTAEEIFLKLKDINSSTCLSTVYRTLETLLSKNIIIKSTLLNENRSCYEINRMEHKHRIICIACNKMENFEYCPFGELEQTLRTRTGFDVRGHKLEIYGYCPLCKANT